MFVENAGFGGTAAAPIASLVVEKYLKRKVDRKSVESKFMQMNYLPNVYSAGGVSRKKVATDSTKK